ncbi:unnamed protein product [Clonostachys rosea]|uniref:AB hydrolase-1 domain-containing protein n=1 Tax=Bionectria ochroleuca TaxID=29856 RepID=A0ABY6TXM0_BIOOC|nr:unnamed protein product [Clonostachys rosea]
MSQTTVQLKDGTNLQVWTFGNENKTKPLLIALHGGPGLSTHETEVQYQFLAENFRVLVYDARGSGRSDLKGPFLDDQWASDVDELREWAQAETFVLAGYSYGGFVALTYALKYQHRLSALILRDTWAFGHRGALGALRSCLISPRIKPDPARQVRLWSGTCIDRQDAEKGLAEIMAIYTPEKEGEVSSAPPAFDLANDGLGLHWEVHNAAWSFNPPRFDVRDKLGSIAVPVFVAVGRHDPICPVDEAEVIAKGVQNSELVIFENSGHNPAQDEPEEFQKEVYRFLRSHIPELK